MPSRSLRVVHYLNQFFGGVGGEDKAGHPVELRGSPAGPGLALAAALGDAGQLQGTIVCGDNYFHEHRELVLERIREWLAAAHADLFIAGPAFNAGRYGAACGDAATLAEELGIASVVGLHPDNPAVALCGRRVHIVPVDASPRTMGDAVRRMCELGVRLARGEWIGSPTVEGYLPRGGRRHAPVDTTGAARAVDRLLAKLHGRPYASDVLVDSIKRGTPASPIADVRRARLVLISTGGIVPTGNPDGLRHINETRWRRYRIGGLGALSAQEWEPIHGGYDATAARCNPNVVVPLDVLRTEESEANIGALHDEYFAVVGVGAPVEVAERIGHEIADTLISGEIEGAILTST
jgi:glycine reductase complex component B subunit gamma